ncbi:MAG: hypothetical protein ACRD0K_31010 [Egibacteraceae bacterium]
MTGHADRHASNPVREGECVVTACGVYGPGDALALEPSWWADRGAVEERRALIEAFRAQDLEEATAELRARCEGLDRARSRGEVVTVGEVAEVLVGQWPAAFHARLADSQRAFFTLGDDDRLARAAEDGRAAAVAVRDRYLAPERISGHSLRQALSLANADASRLRLNPANARHLRPPDGAELSEAAKNALQAHDVVSEWRRGLTEGGDASNVSLGLLATDRAADLIERLPAGDRASVRARIVANERARAAARQHRALSQARQRRVGVA